MSLFLCATTARIYRDKLIFLLLITIIVGYIQMNRNIASLLNDTHFHAPDGEDYEYAANLTTNNIIISQSKSSVVQEAYKLLPPWLQNYIKWHASQIKNPTSSTKYLVLVCLRDMTCGGAADRLKPIPYFLLLANQTNRVFLIKWEKLLLEDFQIPPKGGLDWRYPKDLPLGPHYRGCGRQRGVELHDCHDEKIVNTRVLLINNQQDPYASNIQHFKTDLRPQGTFREIFQILFEPSPPLATIINHTMNKFGLVPGKYLAAHLRMKYPKRFVRPVQFWKKEPNPTSLFSFSDDPKDVKMFKGWAESAINCVVYQADTKDLPVYFSADNLPIISYILNESRFANSSIKVVGIDYGHREDSEHPTWKGISSWEDHNPEEFYNVFLDWYILGNSYCISYGLGGYGLMASRLAGDKCFIKHRVRWDSTKCPSVLDELEESKKSEPIVDNVKKLVEDKNNAIIEESKTSSEHSTTEESKINSLQPKETNGTEIINVRRILNQTNAEQSGASSLQTNNVINDNYNASTPKTSPIVKDALIHVPEWLQNYTKWHSDQLKNRNNSTKYLVLVCLRKMSCGGVSDRLKPLPYILYIAYKTNRVLLIKWEKMSLEAFQIPPPGGLDWRYPKDLNLGIHYKGRCSDCKYYCNLWDCKEDKIINSQVVMIYSQSDSYKKHHPLFETPSRPQGTFREIFQILFQPSPPLANIINQTMTKLGLTPGNYLAAHLRLLYPKRFVRPIEFPNQHSQDPKDLKMFRGWAENAINCVIHKAGIKNLPVYFSADNLPIISYILNQSPFANTSSPKVVGIDYGFREHSEHPSWEKSSKWEDHSPEEFYNVFLDYYIIGSSRCVSYGLGGYGLTGARLTGETCSVQHRIKWDSVKCPSVFDST